MAGSITFTWNEGDCVNKGGEVINKDMDDSQIDSVFVKSSCNLAVDTFDEGDVVTADRDEIKVDDLKPNDENNAPDRGKQHSRSPTAMAEIVKSTKRPRIDATDLIKNPVGSSASNTKATVIHPHVDADPQAESGNVLLPRQFQRLHPPSSLTIDPDYISKLRAANILGFTRPPAQRLPTIRYYTINVDTFRNAISDLITRYLRCKLYESGDVTFALADAEVATMAPIIANASMAALYSKLRTIHTQFQTYAGRFETRPSYTKDIELPLPLADAINNFGVFSPSSTIINYLCVPVYPDNVQNEGCSAQIWSSYHYEAYVPYLKKLGIPVKSVDTCIKNGSAWWTYRPSFANGHFNLRCIFSPINYSDHSAMLAAMFLGVDEAGNVAPIITHLDDDQAYPVRLRQAPHGIQLRVFAALCHAPIEEWN